MVYATEAVIPEEIGELSWRTANLQLPHENDQAIWEELDLVEELRTQAALQETVIKQNVAARYKAKVLQR